MSSTSKAWIAAASVGAVEALKDQMGVCRWNYTFRQLHQHIKNRTRSVSQVKRNSSSASAMNSSSGKRGLENAKRAEESLRTVMYLSCWGPN